MKKLLFVGNPSILGENLENILKQNYHTDVISIVPKQISSIPFNSYNALILDFTMLHKYSLTISKTAKQCYPNIIVLFLCPTNIPEQIILDFYESGADDHLYSTLSSPALLLKKLNILFTNYRLEYSCAMKSHFRKFGNQMSGSGNHLCNYASLLA